MAYAVTDLGFGSVEISRIDEGNPAPKGAVVVETEQEANKLAGSVVAAGEADFEAILAEGDIGNPDVVGGEVKVERIVQL